MPDRLGERLRAVDDEQTRHRWIEAPLDQVVDQCLHHSTVLSCPLHQSKRVLDALAIDPERSHQHEMLTDVDAVDLHHHYIEAGQIPTHPFLHARSRQTPRSAAKLPTSLLRPPLAREHRPREAAPPAGISASIRASHSGSSPTCRASPPPPHPPTSAPP